MKKQPTFGAAIPREEWIQRTVTRDPAPHIPFSYGPAYSPDTFPPMQTWEKVAWAFCVGFGGAVMIFAKLPW